MNPLRVSVNRDRDGPFPVLFLGHECVAFGNGPVGIDDGPRVDRPITTCIRIVSCRLLRGPVFWDHPFEFVNAARDVRHVTPGLRSDVVDEGVLALQKSCRVLRASATESQVDVGDGRDKHGLGVLLFRRWLARIPSPESSACRLECIAYLTIIHTNQ